jgi:hypothetical protein
MAVVLMYLFWKMHVHGGMCVICKLVTPVMLYCWMLSI